MQIPSIVFNTPLIQNLPKLSYAEKSCSNQKESLRRVKQKKSRSASFYYSKWIYECSIMRWIVTINGNIVISLHDVATIRNRCGRDH